MELHTLFVNMIGRSRAQMFGLKNAVRHGFFTASVVAGVGACGWGL